MSQRSLAKRLNICHTYLSKIETGSTDHPPSAGLIKLLAEFSGEPTSKMLHLAGRLTPKESATFKELYVIYGDRLFRLFDLLKKDKEFARKVFSHVK